MNQQGVVIIRSPKSLEMAEEVNGLTRFRMNVYGDSVLSYYHRAK